MRSDRLPASILASGINIGTSFYSCTNAVLDDVLYYELSRASAEVVEKRIGSRELKCAPGLEYFVSYSAGGFLNLLHRWIIDGMEETPEKYAKNVREALLRYMAGT